MSYGQQKWNGFFYEAYKKMDSIEYVSSALAAEIMFVLQYLKNKHKLMDTI